MSYSDIVISSPDSTGSTVADLEASDNETTANKLVDYVSRIGSGARSAAVTLRVNAIQAYGLITSTGSASNGETGTVANITLTAKTSGAVAANGEFNISATPTTQAASMVLAINAVSGLTGLVTATNALGVVTITATVPGIVGNGLDLTEAFSNVTKTAFAHGSDGDKVTRNYGY